jgi:hypothetical protein
VSTIQISSPIAAESSEFNRTNTPYLYAPSNSMSSVSGSSHSRQTTIISIDNSFNTAFHNIAKTRATIASEKQSEFKEELNVLKAAIKFFSAVQQCEKIIERASSENLIPGDDSHKAQMEQITIARNRISTESVIQETNINKMRAIVEASVTEAWFYADSFEKYKLTPGDEWTKMTTTNLIALLNDKIASVGNSSTSTSDAWSEACYAFVNAVTRAKHPREVEDEILALKAKTTTDMPAPSNVNSIYTNILENRRSNRIKTYGLEIMAQVISGHTETYKGTIPKPYEYTIVVPEKAPSWYQFIKNTFK